MALFDRFKKKSAAKDESTATLSTDSEVANSEVANSEVANSEVANSEVANSEVTEAGASQQTDSPIVESPTSAVSKEPEAPKQGMFARLRQGLQRTTQVLNTDVRDLFKSDGQLLDDEFLSNLYGLLIRTDMGAGPARKIREQLLTEYRGRVVQMEEVLNVIKSQLKELTDQTEAPLTLSDNGPTVIMVVGVNGSGKTTSIAKLTARLKAEGKAVILGAADTFRAAAVEQLTIWSERLGAEIIKGDPGGDPASVAHRAVARALESNADICIIDTAGRLQTQVNLMEQLSKIKRVISKQIPAAPHEVLLVLDATAGQNGLSQAKGFSDAAGCTGIVLAKLDGTAKGGVVIPIRQQFQLPVKFIGTGEQPTDLAPFDSEQFVEALFAEI